MSLHTIIRDWLIDPTSLLFLSVLLVWCYCLLRVRSWKLTVLCSVSLVLFLVFSAPTIVNPMVVSLESQFVPEPACLHDDAFQNKPIVVLAGGVDSRVEQATEFERMSEATLARVAGGLRVASMFTGASLIASGGGVRSVSEASVMVNFWLRAGVSESRVFEEGTSANTAQNAHNVKQLLDRENLGDTVFLVTSALHMPRANATFLKTGLQVCAVPVGFIGLPHLPWYASMPQTTALRKFDQLLHELIAIGLYRFKGQA